MKARDFRMGNYIWLDLGLPSLDVHKIKSKDFAYLGEYLFAKKAMPIPLTEEWLIKFGFETILHKYHKKQLVLFGDSDEYPNGASFINGNDIGVDFPLYVHQLQNLYFALTSEELELATETQSS